MRSPALGLLAARAPLAGAALLSLVTLACAHAPERDVLRSAATSGGDHAKGTRSATLLPRPDVKRPESRFEARDMLERAFQAAADGQHEVAAAHYGAVLATDYLTDRGRANLYWMRAESFAALDDDDGRRDALLGFLVASELSPLDAEAEQKRLLARSALTAMRVEEDPAFGRSPEEAITVEDLREPASIMSSLSCGPRRDAQYVDVAIRSVRKEESALVHRRAECERDGAVLELWFDVTHAAKGR